MIYVLAEKVMFGISDIPKFFLAFFLVLPAISLIHEGGHVLFIWLMGGKNIKVRIGSGKTKFRIGMLEIRKHYFWYGSCTFENLESNKRFSNILIFLGGALFNALAAVGIIALVENKTLEPTIITYQFIYFSLYYIFFALLPMPYPDGTYSDGKIILDLVRNKRTMIQERVYRIQWNEKKEQWQVLDHNRELILADSKEEEALLKAREIAQNNRPSKILSTINEEEREVENYPRIPL